ncbi:MAG: DUF4392 domain-containing protein [Synergistaceae bacterium]|jgi:hypothetical protein|nr:DUF4392 domain-containing protein [Synergistaceae bacterium]
MSDDGIFRGLAGISAGGVSGRGPSAVRADGLGVEALDFINAAQNVAVIAVFPYVAARAPETDGPAESVVPARVLLRVGIETKIRTHFGACRK